ncbi:DUF2061 domain-containing protein [Haematospirillum jordaniae]|uniref:DUF2061 domain-containing protein n=1 Tax=Haematospirillum jordaniae TaxID=1549855 RepID=A0A143DBC4_9PROT|nr:MULTISPECIES: DUF2061 domain-containing protein [Haematospirillum]AMW33889.1 hypothetical protein AY555_00445 [Haematospirillum jordaniae]NKD44466.1 DUF2061 domain-containing protein [Haematospirillum jordaniae]NKD54893.1 DUF2061 domain-containing protein [Haematospirillum sp. H4890]NKD57486.1 DUF2061 domain-containing protein [Haematospirillum jordaniae]NKD59536.1 DUF2061 domain-containing protein [Haematospirillum jordaniae]
MRDILKTGSFAVLHFCVGFAITYLLTGSIAIATGVALLEPTANTIVFYFHEKVWNKFSPQSKVIGACGGHKRLAEEPFGTR